ncbi:MAG TPA: hypothetical protein VFE05_06345 [Longimicrobiaceae bacterium]|jgi:hypothetical protein|nr:hypothetical protein [Longimicrobiaceae bacterium]
MPESHRTLGRVSADGSLTLRDLPFPAGTTVEVVLRQASEATDAVDDRLRGQVITYADPMEPVAEGEWEVLKDR